MNTQAAHPQIPGYEILSRLGGRRLGVVYKAKQISLDRLVALRVLDPAAAADPAQLRRLRSQAQAATLHQGNLVHVIEVGEHEGHHYLVMEFVSGFNLASLIASKKLMPAAEARVVMQSVAEALDYVHRNAGIVHGDLRPENILVDDDGTVKISDLRGFALSASDEASPEAEPEDDHNPYYTGQPVDGEKVDPLADIRALGRLLYHAIVGNPMAPDATRDDVCAVFLQVAQLHPDAATREDAATTAHLLLDLIEAGPDQKVQSWKDVLTLLGSAPSPVVEPKAPFEATQVIPDLAAQVPLKRKKTMVLRKPDPLTEPEPLPATPVFHTKHSHFPTRLVIAMVLLLVGAALFWADYQTQLFDPIRDFRDAKLGGLRKTEPPPIAEERDLEEEPESEAEEALAIVEPPDESLLEQEKERLAAERAELHAYLDGMEDFLRLVAQRDLPAANRSIDTWLAAHPDNTRATSMRHNKTRALAIARTYSWLQANNAALRGLVVSEGQRTGNIERIQSSGLILRQQRGAATVDVELSFHELSYPNLLRLVRHTEPGTEEEHLFAAYMAAGRYDDAATELGRLTLPAERTAFLQAWQEEWSEARLNLQALRALSAIEEDLDNNRPIQARDKLDLAEQRFRHSDIFLWAEPERMQRLQYEVRGTP